jgi:preprotein translocase subunit SecD
LSHATPQTLSAAVAILQARAQGAQVAAAVNEKGSDEIDIKTSAPLLQAQDLFGHADVLHFATAAFGAVPTATDLSSSCPTAVQFLADQENLYDPMQISDPALYPSGYHWKIDDALPGSDVTSATPAVDSQTNENVLDISFNSRGANEWNKITIAAFNQPPGSPQNVIAIFLGGSIISAPAVQGPSSSQTEISGGGITAATATQLADEINAGALPAPVTVLNVQTFGGPSRSPAATTSILSSSPTCSPPATLAPPFTAPTLTEPPTLPPGTPPPTPVP